VARQGAGKPGPQGGMPGPLWLLRFLGCFLQEQYVADATLLALEAAPEPTNLEQTSHGCVAHPRSAGAPRGAAASAIA
jgi:hypothetical protein